ncbi:MAG: hypothetical protein JXA73_11505 [Acidobacteria bacterium]|nr:hypothetical protein [Acidobacteriota bacterium]
MIGSVPFIDLNARIQGVLRLEDEELILEWHKRIAWLLLTDWPFKKPALQQFHIPLSQLDEIRYENPWYLFHATLHIKVRSLEILAQIPGSDGAEITLYCKKRYKHLAQEIANTATFQKLERVFPEKGVSANV